MTPTVLSLLSAEALRRNYAAGYWRNETICALAQSHATRAPGRFAIRDKFRRRTYRELVDRADVLAESISAILPGGCMMAGSCHIPSAGPAQRE